MVLVTITGEYFLCRSPLTRVADSVGVSQSPQSRFVRTKWQKLRRAPPVPAKGESLPDQTPPPLPPRTDSSNGMFAWNATYGVMQRVVGMVVHVLIMHSTFLQLCLACREHSRTCLQNLYLQISLKNSVNHDICIKC